MFGGRFQKAATIACFMGSNALNLWMQQFGFNSLGMTPQNFYPEDFALSKGEYSGFGIFSGMRVEAAGEQVDSIWDSLFGE